MPVETVDVEVVGAESAGPTSLLGRIATARRSLGDWGVHASGRFDRSDAKWIAAFREYVKLGIFLSGTEAAGRDPAQFKAGMRGVRGTWASAHLTGPAAGECWFAWDTRAAELEKAYAHKLTDMTWTRSAAYGGKQAAKVHGLVLRLHRTRGRKRKRIIYVIVHMPLDNTPQRAACWVDVCRGLVELVQQLRHDFPDAAIVLVGDWNKNLRRLVERAMVHRHLLDPLGMVTSWHLGLPNGGTLTGSSAVIDFAIAAASLLGKGQRLEPSGASDHIAIRYRLRGWLSRLLG